ncbi:MAG: phage tail protein [Lachnospiraceae bacterium]|nr:phage tail protein [Lachnospiraceae bacterium]
MSKGLREIDVIIDGKTEPLNKALSKINAETKGLQKELKGVETLLKFDPKNTDLLAQKQTILSQSIEQTENKLKTLTQAQKQMAEAGKDVNDEGYRDLQREIAATTNRLEELRKQRIVFDVLKQGAKDFTKTIGEAAMMSPKINKLVTGFQNVKQKITETVKESAAVQKIGSAVEGARQKVEAFKDAHPKVMKVAEAFGKIKDTAGELKSKLPTLQQSLAAVGNAAAGAAKGGFKALEVTIGGTMKAFAAFSTAALTAGAAIAKNAVEQYADYEQLVGGVETLFGAGGQSLGEYAKSVGKTTQDAKKEYDSLMKAQETVLKNADNAYKTAGLSANEYMDTVTGFSAALISSLDGDTEAAAKKADMAITDMADNANKMGSDISSIQTAYQGFAKQNYTMLDNLKLGYGGTKTEMERLLADATKLSGVKYDISSYADIVDAIHVVQTEMGITGTTAKEASETISGSINAAKSAYQNLMTGLADENADLDGLIGNMADSVLTVVDNVLPRIMETVPRIVETVPKLIEGLSAAFAGIAGQLGGLADQLLPPLMQAFFALIRTVTGALPTLLPQILNAAITLFSGLLQGLNETIPQIMAMLPTLIQTISSTLIANLPQLITAGVQILVNIINGITQAIPTLISAIVELIPVIVQTIAENLPLIIDAGLNLLLSLVSGIVQAIPQLVAMLPTIINTIVTQIVSMLPRIIETGIQLLNSLVSGIIQAIPQLIAALPQIITSTVNTITANLPKIIQTGIELLGALISGIIRAIPSLVAALPQVFNAIINAFKGINWADLGKNIIDGVINGVKNAASSLINVFKDLAKSALNAVKDFFGIASPSKVMRDQVGKMLPAGMAEGVEEGMDAEEERIRAAMARGVPTTIDGYIKSGGSSTGGGDIRAAGGDFVQNLTINSPRELSPSETARLNRNAVRQTVLKLKPT